MATNNPNVDAIVGYVEQHNLPLLSKSILGATSTQYFNIMTGVKGTSKLNILDADPSLQCGDSCGFNPDNETTFTQREIKAIPFKVVECANKPNPKKVKELIRLMSFCISTSSGES